MRGRSKFIGIIAAIAFGVIAPAAAATGVPPGFTAEVLAQGFNQTTAVAWTPDGRMLVAEKPGTVQLVEAEAKTGRRIIDISDQVNDHADRGLLGIAVDAAFSSNRFVYLLFTREMEPLQPDGDGPMASRLTRHVMAPDGSLGSGLPILGTYEGLCPAPDDAIDCLPSEGDSHSIGSVRVAPDGTLFVGSGDAAGFGKVEPLAMRTYDERTLAGKIVHIDRDGRGLPGHGFCPGEADLTRNCTKLFAKGFRNPFRFTVRPAGAGLLVGDVGWGTTEEIDLIRTPGRSYGWPCYEGTPREPGYAQLPGCQTQYALEGGPQANVPPDFEYRHADPPGAGYGAVIGGPVYQGTDYPAGFRGSAFIGDYAKGVLRRITLDGDTVTGVEDFGTNWYGTDLQASPGGDIVTVFFGDGSPGTGHVERIRYLSGNRTPVADAAATPVTGAAPLEVSFDGRGSSDPDGDTLTYSWDPGDGSPALTGAQPTHVYDTRGVYTATLTVDDGRGLTATDTIRIDAGDDPPAVDLAAPADGSAFRIGIPVALRGSATDPQDGPLPASALRWDVTLLHGEHLHPLTTIEGQAEASFLPREDHDADGTYRIRLTATDSAGLSTAVAHTVGPQTVTMTVASEPAGAPVTYGGTSGAAPLTRTAAVGHRTTITAAVEFSSAGRRFVFDRWSDGGARVHDIVVPDADHAITATYRDDGPDLPADLVAAFGFDQGAGESAADVTGHDHHAYLEGPSWVTGGRHGGALSFDGLDDLATVANPDGVPLTGPHTISAWVRPRTLKDWQSILVRETPGGFTNALYATNGGGQGKVNGWIGDTGVYSRLIATDRWTHVALTSDGARGRIYLDGVLVGNAPAGAAPAGPGPLRLGGNRIWPGETLDGLLDDVRIYSRAQSAAEIQADMATPLPAADPPPPPPPPPPPSREGLVLELDFEESSGSTVTDTSGGGHDGTVSGAARTADGHTGRALRFDGSGDRVTIPDHADLDLAGAMTLEAWINPDTAKGWQTVMLKEGVGSYAYGLYATNGGQGKANAWVGDLGAYTGSATPAGRWLHLATTYDGRALRIYLDGQLVATATGVSAAPVTSGPLRIGDNSIWSGEGFDGAIDAVRVWSRALTASEIAGRSAAAATASLSSARRSGASSSAKRSREGRRGSRFDTEARRSRPRRTIRAACRRPGSAKILLARRAGGRVIRFRPRTCPGRAHRARPSKARKARRSTRAARTERAAERRAARRGPR